MSSLPATQWTLPDHAARDHDISVLPRIFEDAINIAIFQRPLPADIAFSAQAQCQTDRAWQYSWLGHPDTSAIQRLSPGDIALIKGSGWVGCEERGLVHRSPALENGSKRLLMSIDPF